MRQKPLGRHLVRGHDVRVDVEVIDALECPIRSASSRAGIPDRVPGGTAAVAKIVP